ncbi:SRPBCC family protein [Anabaena sp. FACHB-1237]|uniref:SRPBCC family protein n=1 Tax=Anabaena sp. FACHB-1237 TaxID=2692769 RepID=UPI00167FEEA7|nr:SRPBCC family protein [Anabaena sp. FACHB-1237]MBD2136580.1 SRPBCC family protein [Anabaena sp. FACHB-1237]
MNTDLSISNDNFPADNLQNWENFDDTNLVDHTDEANDVEIIVKKLSHRERQIIAKIKIPHPMEKVWQILTDYESLPDFIPNLAQSRLLDHPDGGIRLEQVGSEKLLNFKFCARVVLDLQELFPQLIKFNMVEGDFKSFTGNWCLEPYCTNDEQGTTLCYTIQLLPKLSMPISIIERRLKKDLQTNLLAIRQRAFQSKSYP